MTKHVEKIAGSQPSPSEPSVEWGLEKLAQFVRDAGGKVGDLEAVSLQIGSKILRLHYNRGKALVLIRDEVLGKKRQAWARFRKENGFVGTTFDDDIRLYESAISWEEISGMGLTEARIYLGVTRPRVRKPKEVEPAPVPKATSAEAVRTAPMDGAPATQAVLPNTTEEKDRKRAQESAATDAVGTTATDEVPASQATVTTVAGMTKDQPDTPATAPVPTAPSRVSGKKPSADCPPSPEETLIRIIHRLEELEREVPGLVAEAALPLIDQAIEVLGRLRGVAIRQAA